VRASITASQDPVRKKRYCHEYARLKVARPWNANQADLSSSISTHCFAWEGVVGQKVNERVEDSLPPFVRAVIEALVEITLRASTACM